MDITPRNIQLVDSVHPSEGVNSIVYIVDNKFFNTILISITLGLTVIHTWKEQEKIR